MMKKEKSIFLIIVLLMIGCVNSSGAGNAEIITNADEIGNKAGSTQGENTQGSKAINGGKPAVTFIRCTDPRPQMCTMEYAPVCGAINCDGESCSPSDWKTYSNGCTACGNTQVTGYYRGECNQSD